jgi:FKBP-type peptidyl-prolyl cis-trans isomerase
VALARYDFPEFRILLPKIEFHFPRKHHEICRPSTIHQPPPSTIASELRPQNKQQHSKMVSASNTRIILPILALAAATVSAADLKVQVYEGPTECTDENKVQKGNYLSMHYTGTIDESSATGEKGKQFDSSRDRGDTFDFTIGSGQVIRGWEEGLLGLCVGAKANLIIPPEMGYGERGAGGAIPGGATLKFDVEVVAISNEPKNAYSEQNLFDEIDANKDGKLDKEEVAAYFKSLNQDVVPEALWETEDKNKDGVISWEEFSGPKGTNPLGDEL